MTAKADFLGRLRTAVGSGAPPPHRPLVPVTRPPEVTPRWADAEAPLVERWVAAFEGLGGVVHRASEADLASTLATTVAGRGPLLVDARFARRIAGESPALGERLGEQVLLWPECGLGEAATAATGVVEATAAIAATGSVLVDTSRSGRLVSLLPPVGVFVVRAETVVALAGDVLRRHAERWPDGPPANVLLITGPSRSGDIEMKLVVGVHGPGSVHAVLVESG